jgi:hypothetical protein
MNETVGKIFLNGVKDTKGLYRLIDQLESVTKELYHNQEGAITQKLQGKLLASIQAIFVWLEQNKLEPAGDSEQKQFIEDIIDYLRKVPQVKVTLAFEPDDLFTSKLNEEISAQSGQKVILDISVNHHIVGGLVLEYRGKHKDYSVEPKVNDYLKNNLGKFFQKEVEVSK